MKKHNETLFCIECLSPNDVRTANGIPICNKCILESREQLKSYENSKVLRPEIDEILEGKLYLGNYDQAKIKEDLKKHKITHVLVCGAGLDAHFPKDFTYLQFDLEDIEEEDIKRFFPSAIEFIEKGECVFVHCHAGVSRSASIVIAYLMTKFGYNYQDAFNFLKLKRPCIFPHPKFREDLKLFEKEISLNENQ
jgi:protein-tyrosine phosphatase